MAGMVAFLHGKFVIIKQINWQLRQQSVYESWITTRWDIDAESLNVTWDHTWLCHFSNWEAIKSWTLLSISYDLGWMGFIRELRDRDQNMKENLMKERSFIKGQRRKDWKHNFCLRDSRIQGPWATHQHHRYSSFVFNKFSNYDAYITGCYSFVSCQWMLPVLQLH